MASFIDEMKKNRNDFIRKEDSDLEFEDKIMKYKNQILARLMKYEAKASVEVIKHALLSEQRENPKSNNASVKYRYPDMPRSWDSLPYPLNIREVGVDTCREVEKIFKEFGIVPEPSRYVTDKVTDKYTWNDIFKKLDLPYVWLKETDDYDRPIALIISFGEPLYKRKVDFALFSVFEISECGKIYFEALKNAAEAEGINVEYENTLTHQYGVQHRKGGVYLIASVSF